MNTTHTKEVAVIGAGMAGLVAAYQLGKTGAKVTVFEKDHAAGGRAKTTNKDGFELNVGPHALYKAGELHQFLLAEGLLPAGAPPVQNKAIALVDGRVAELPQTVAGIMFSDYLSLGERIELATVLGGVAKMDYESIMAISLSDWLSAHVKGLRARQTLEALVRLGTYGNGPDTLSAGAAFHQLARGLDGVLYLDHGWNSMVQKLRDAMPPNVVFTYGAQVELVRDSADGVGVDVVLGPSHETHHFDATILCVPPLEVNRMTGGAIDDATLSSLKPAYAACLDIGLKRLPVPETTFALGIDEPLYFSVHSAAAKLAPEGAAMVHAAYYWPADGTLDQHAVQDRLHALMDQLQPGWRDEVAYKRFLPHITVSFSTPIAALDGYAGLRSPRLPQRENIYAAGEYVGKDSCLVDCSVKSVLEAVQLIEQSNGANSVPNQPRLAIR